MKGTSAWVFAFLPLAFLASTVDSARARKSTEIEPTPHVSTHTTDETVRAEAGLAPNQFFAASVNTTVLYAEDFDQGGSCTAAGWIEVDMTAQIADFFHVDDYAGLSFGPLRGTKSLWCGARSWPTYCGYATLPGYGNNWDQAFCTKSCLTYTGTVAVDYLARWDTEPGYDRITLEYTTECTESENWGYFVVDYHGIGNALRHDTFTAPANPAKIRIRFRSGDSWSDEDGLYASDGALHVDSLSVSDGTGLRVAVETFEDETIGATSTNEWETCNVPGFGSFAFVTHGSGVLQQDPCVRDLSCLWAFFENSPNTYSCGGFPNQKVVPYRTVSGRYIHNEIWSPPIALTGTGNDVTLRGSVYRDLGFDAELFYVWHVRSLVDGCWGPWRDRNFVYFGQQKDWFEFNQPVGDLLELGQATHVQVALGVIDACYLFFCFMEACRSQSPLFDNVRLLRIDVTGPRWTINDIDQFQDNFSTNGTITGTVRADAARDIRPQNNPSIVPGDSAIVTVSDPVNGIANDLVNGGKKIYLYVSVLPKNQPAKSGGALTQNPTRFPYAGNQVIGGRTWNLIRLDQCVLNGNPVANRFCVDLNDNLFTPCDTVHFFYGAENTSGVRTYATGGSLGQYTDDVNQAALHASEFTCLPAGGWKRGGSILYVDGMDGRGAQPFWDTALQALSILHRVDRYDVRGPSSRVANRPSSRVKDVLVQLLDCYTKVLWDCGDLTVGLGAGFGQPGEKTDDYGMVNTFLNNLNTEGGVYICGDDIAHQLANFSTSPSAVTFKSTYLTFTLTSGNHVLWFDVSPVGRGTAGNCFNGDTFVISGGCPLINDFDVMAPTGSSIMEVSYGTPAANNGAVLSKKTLNANNVEVGMLFSGFAFEYLRDDDNDGIMDRADHLHDILTWLEHLTPNPTDASPALRNSLSQNYPNPFNPQTTIAFTLKQRGDVTLKVYNVAGELVRTLANESLAAGPHTKVWDGRDKRGESVASGVYLYRLTTTGFEETRKMVLLK